MRNEQAQAKNESKDALLGVLMGLVLVAGAVLSLGVAPTELDTGYTDVGRPEAAGLASTPSDGITPPAVIAQAQTDSFDLQLD